VRTFGTFLTVVGIALAALGARAISDPDSPLGWQHWSDNRWSTWLITGAILFVFGVVLLLRRKRGSAAGERRAARFLATTVAMLVGFILLAPLGTTVACTHPVHRDVPFTSGSMKGTPIDGGRHSTCTVQSWSATSGLTFSGRATAWPAVLTAVLSATGMWLVVGRVQKESG
jgi:hypothetical protein